MVKEGKSELTLCGFLSALSFGSSFEELANFLIDKIDVTVEITPRTAIELSQVSANRFAGLGPQAQEPNRADDYFDPLTARLRGELA